MHIQFGVIMRKLCEEMTVHNWYFWLQYQHYFSENNG